MDMMQHFFASIIDAVILERGDHAGVEARDELAQHRGAV